MANASALEGVLLLDGTSSLLPSPSPTAVPAVDTETCILPPVAPPSSPPPPPFVPAIAPLSLTPSTSELGATTSGALPMSTIAALAGGAALSLLLVAAGLRAYRRGAEWRSGGTSSRGDRRQRKHAAAIELEAMGWTGGEEEAAASPGSLYELNDAAMAAHAADAAAANELYDVDHDEPRA